MNPFIQTLKAISPIMLSLNLMTFGFLLAFAPLSKAFASTTVPNQKSYSFKYNANLSITVQAQDYDSAFKLAAKKCYSSLSQGKYPGESRGLAMIDICANPK